MNPEITPKGLGVNIIEKTFTKRFERLIPIVIQGLKIRFTLFYLFQDFRKGLFSFSLLMFRCRKMPSLFTKFYIAFVDLSIQCPLIYCLQNRTARFVDVFTVLKTTRFCNVREFHYFGKRVWIVNSQPEFTDARRVN